MPSERAIDSINKCAAAGQPFVSIEFFPPKTEKGVTNLMDRAGRMKKHDPLFVDMTWGAGGSTSELTLDLCVRLLKEHGLESNMHLTCTNMEAEKVDIALAGAKEAGIRNIVALRGDAPAGQEEWTATEGGFTCALDLIKYIRNAHGDLFSISCSGYPEGHPNVITKVEDEASLSPSEKTRVIEMEDGLYVCKDEAYKTEMEYLKQKVDAGADFIITQMIFDADLYKTFVADCKAIGINVPILPGIMCIANVGGFKRMTAFCKSRTPKSLGEKLDAAPEGDAEAVRAVAIDFCTELCQGLLDNGAPGLHFYTLNLEKVTEGVLEKLKLGAYAEAAEGAAVAAN
eukprot:m.322070 g.322070  ORF g.322070 m.322070 type:complete len:343 (+) comp19713_c0_seq35:278-1306(+)